MQYTALFLSAIVATGAMAAPAMSGGAPGPASSSSSGNKKSISPMGVRITLDGRPDVFFEKDHFDSDVDFEHTFKKDRQGPFGKVTLELGPKVKNQEVRCKIFDDQETPKPIIVTRGKNIDVAFSKGDPWTFKDGKTSKVTKVACGPSQIKADQNAVKDIVVSLKRAADPGTVVTQDISLTKFEEDKLPQKKMPQGTTANKKFNEVKLAVGFAVKNRDLRCQVLDMHKKPIIVKRGKNIDFTFGDGDNPNAWTFINGPSEVSDIVCDPKFKKADASDKVNKPKAN